jgi:hypothetical protein
MSTQTTQPSAVGWTNIPLPEYNALLRERDDLKHERDALTAELAAERAKRSGGGFSVGTLVMGALIGSVLAAVSLARH